ncbi:MAG TPA: DUF962 domain-containing protein [Alphaproteobacteria bacterium]|nr:DUF962 domain-containing protein [Alphaproteobacteria bacterium]
MTFQEFWKAYLKAHSKSATRLGHYFATLVGASGVVVSILTGQWYWVVITIACGYVIAILSHWLVEGNQPLIKVNAFYGAVSDIRMLFLCMTGQLNKEYTKLGITNKGWGAGQQGSSNL